MLVTLEAFYQGREPEEREEPQQRVDSHVAQEEVEEDPANKGWYSLRSLASTCA